MSTLIKETLEKQLQILSERSVRERGEILPNLTRAMLDVATYLDGESHETFPHNDDTDEAGEEKPLS